MNKKLLFAAMSLAAFTACTDNDFESQKVAEETSPIQIELINFSDGMTRASMNGNTIKWSATDGDLFTLYHGGAAGAVTGFQNATYTAKAVEGQPAALTTPSMILPGEAIMVWPVDTAFNIGSGDNLSISIPDEQTNIENNIPYVSDRFTIANYAKLQNDPSKAGYNEYNSAGKDRKYTIYMRPMASQLNLKADYVGMDDIKALEEGEDGIDPIKLTSVDLLTKTGGTSLFTKKVEVKWAGSANANWPTTILNKSWSDQTQLDVAAVAATGTQVDKLTSKEECLNGNDGCKFLILPQPTISGGVDEAAIVVNTIYGKVVIQDPAVVGTTTKYNATEYKNAWYRYLSTRKTAADAEENASATTAETAGDNAGKYKTVAKSPALGMQQTINTFSNYTAPSGTVKGEYMGVASTRYVNVILNHIDMSDLHIKTDKQLRDAAKVWKKMGLDDVTVYLDGNAAGEFEISQKTIKVINEINAAVAGKDFKVKPCQDAGEVCSKIVITGASEEANVQNLDFIRDNATVKADVILKAGESWVWNGTVKVATATGINQFINKGTLTNNADKVLAIYDNVTPTAAQVFSIPLINDGTWNVTAGTLRVQFNVTNNGTVNISKGAQYRQDGQDVLAKKTTFTNEATDKPSRFGGNDSKIGKVENKGVFATIGGADINNYGLIEHADEAAKTYITANQTLAANGFSANASFTTAFKHDATGNTGNKMGRINLPYSNKEEDNISVSAALAQGFVSVTVTTADAPSNGILNASVVGNKVNYVIVNGGIKSIAAVATQVKYVEFNQPNTEIEWAVAEAGYDGLMVLSPVNIKLDTKVAATVTYIGSEMYVGGTFNKDAAVTIGTTPYPVTLWNGYYGNTTTDVATKYITF